MPQFIQLFIAIDSIEIDINSRKFDIGADIKYWWLKCSDWMQSSVTVNWHKIWYHISIIIELLCQFCMYNTYEPVKAKAGFFYYFFTKWNLLSTICILYVDGKNIFISFKKPKKKYCIVALTCVLCDAKMSLID